MEQANIEINEQEFYTILSSLNLRKDSISKKINEWQEKIETGYYKEYFTDGFEETVKGWITENKSEFEELEACYRNLVSKYVRAKK